MDQDIGASVSARARDENLATMLGADLLDAYQEAERDALHPRYDFTDSLGRRKALRSEILRRLRLAEPKRFT